MKKPTTKSVARALLILALISVSFAYITDGIKNMQSLISPYMYSDESVIAVHAYYNSSANKGIGSRCYQIYHKPGCRYLSEMEDKKRLDKAEGTIFYWARHQAEENGYTACNYCFR